MKDLEPKWISFGWGFALWLIVMLAGGRGEAWDSPLYVSVGLPLLVVGAGAAGYFYPQAAWRWGVWMGAGHAAAAMIAGLLNGHGFGMLPLGLGLLVLMSIPLVLFAATCAVFSKWINKT